MLHLRFNESDIGTWVIRSVGQSDWVEAVDTALCELAEHWLVREVSIYPTEESVYRLGTEPDGSVVIEELSTSSLADTLAGVVGTLPNLLTADASLKSPLLAAHPPK